MGEDIKTNFYMGVEAAEEEEKAPGGLSGRGLRIWGFVFLLAGAISHGILQNSLLGLNTVTGAQLLEIMDSSRSAMILATAALILQVIESCAVPVFAFLLLEGFLHTGNVLKYLLRLAGAALLSEIPYNLAIGGSWIDAGSRNPVFGLVLGLILLYVYDRYAEKTGQNITVKVVVTLAAVAWAGMLKVDYGFSIILLVCVLWIFRRNAVYQNLAAATASVACTIASPLFLGAPMGCLVVHFYNGTKGKINRWIAYGAYPVLLLAVWLITLFF